MSTFTLENTQVAWEIEGGGQQRKGEDGGMVVALEHWNRGLDTTEMFAELPDGACQEQHWGYVISGGMTIRYTDGRTETISGGQAYYLAPGHNVTVEADIDLVEFTPSDQRPDQRPAES
jgi:hypothetical protein